MQIAQYLFQTVGTRCAGNELLGSFQVAVLQGQHTEVGLCLRQRTCQRLSLLDILLGGIVVATGKLDGSQVVESTGIVGINLCGQFVDVLLGIDVLLKGSAIEQFLNAQFGDIILDLLQDLVIAATHGLVVDGETRTAQLRQDAIGQLTEGGRDVFNLLLTLLGILIHREYAQDDVLVLNVAGLYQFLESLPVLSGVFRIDIGVHLNLLQLLVHILLRHLLTLIGQFVVDAEAAIGRGVC